MCTVYIDLSTCNNTDQVDLWRLFIQEKILPILRKHGPIECRKITNSCIEVNCYGINLLECHMLLEENELYMHYINIHTMDTFMYSPRFPDCPVIVKYPKIFI